MSKKNIDKNSSKSNKKINNSKSEKKNIKKIKISDEEFDSEDFSSLEELNFIKEVDEKNKIERQIKGEKEIIDGEVDKEKLDKTINKNINEESKKEPGKTTSIVKKTRKETLVDSVIDAYNKLEIPESERMTSSQLKKEKINILEKKLSELTEKIVAKIATNKNISTEPQGETVSISNELAVNALFNVNIIMTTFIENVADTARQNEATKKYVPNITGLSKRLMKPEKEKQLKECLKSIIELHGDKIKPYMSPISIWLMFMITSMSEQISENFSKNSQEPITHTD